MIANDPHLIRSHRFDPKTGIAKLRLRPANITISQAKTCKGAKMADSMTVTVHQEMRTNVLLLWIDNPPVNALGAALRADLAHVIAQAAKDVAVQAVVILAKGRMFSAGADISEFGNTPSAPLLPALCDAIEACPKPVIAALHGSTLGGGLELALAAHYRIALEGTKLGLPEVGLGILPGAGGTQRLPRLIGAEAALQMMLTGQPVSARVALASGLLDQVTTEDLTSAALALAQSAVHLPIPMTCDRRSGFGAPIDYAKAVAKARKSAIANPLSGPARIVDCVEAAQLLPFEQGLAFERAAFSDLVKTPQAEALRHMFFAEGRAAKMPAAQANARPINSVTVLGAGEDAIELSLLLLSAGIEVMLAEHSKSALVPGLERIAMRLDRDCEAGRLTTAEKDMRWALLVPELTLAMEAPGDLIFVTGAFRDAGAVLPQFIADAGCAVVTLGRLGVGGPQALGLEMGANALAGGSTTPGPLAEIIVGPNTADDAVATLLALLRRLGRVVVQANGTAIGPEMIRAMHLALLHQEDQQGAGPVLDLLQRWGMAGAAATVPSDLWGGIAAPVLGALANCGMRLLGEGRAQRPSDIDLVMSLGQGFPRWGGGPMLWAQRRGLLVLRQDLDHWAQDAPELYAPAPLLTALIHDGLTLAALNDA
jgi:3-hydroxyacyl-CoA dehydrogenase